MLWLALHFPCLPPDALAPIAAWACQFTPKVSLEPPNELALEVQGSLRLFGGYAALQERVFAGLGELGYGFSSGTASTALAALWLARGKGEALESLPVEVARLDSGFLRSVGVGTIGELLALPRHGLGRRCGARTLEALERALGTLPEPRAWFSPPARFEAKLELPAPVAQAEALLFAARRLLVQLEGLLVARHEGVRGFLLELGEASIQVGLASATRDANRMGQVLRERLAQMTLKQPVEILRLEAGDFAPLYGASGGLFGDPAAEAEGWARLVERLRARLGREAVCGLAVQPDHRPEHAWRRVEPGEWDPREYRAPGPRPSWLLEARKLGDGFELLAGPERIESGWWDGDDAKRDYFVARLPSGSLAWIYREAGEWYLHGLFA